MASTINKYSLSAQPALITASTSDCNDTWQREDVADQGSRLLMAVTNDFSLDDTVLDLDDYIQST